MNWTPPKNSFWKIEPPGFNGADTVLVSIEKTLSELCIIFLLERLHHGLHGPTLAPTNTTLFYEGEEDDDEDEEDDDDMDDEDGMVMNADSTGDPEIKVD